MNRMLIKQKLKGMSSEVKVTKKIKKKREKREREKRENVSKKKRAQNSKAGNA